MSNFHKVAYLFSPGNVINNIDGESFRVISKTITSDNIVFKLANLQGKRIDTPPDFFPVSHYAAKLARCFRILSYNKDWDLYVKEYIKSAGLPVDPTWNWANWFQRKFIPLLHGDEEHRDEAVHNMIFKTLGAKGDKRGQGGRAALDPNNPYGFQHVISRFPKEVQDLPLDKQVTQFLLHVFKHRVGEANQD